MNINKAVNKATNQQVNNKTKNPNIKMEIDQGLDFSIQQIIYEAIYDAVECATTQATNNGMVCYTGLFVIQGYRMTLDEAADEATDRSTNSPVDVSNMTMVSVDHSIDVASKQAIYYALYKSVNSSTFPAVKNGYLIVLIDMADYKFREEKS